MFSERAVRMLVVEDSEDDALLLYSELKTRGAIIDYRRVDNARDMTAALLEKDWEVIICDHSMPSFDSMQALQVLKGSGKDIPFIIYSGDISEKQAILAMNEGVSDYIGKGKLAHLIPVIQRELLSMDARRAVRQAGSRIEELAFHDGLTNLPNHKLLCTRLDEAIGKAKTGCQDLHGALFYIDIDRFLRINNSFGYETGNEILRQVASRLAKCAEGRTFLARVGGDEFAIFHPGMSQPDEAEKFAQWVLEAFDAPFMKDGLELYLTSSIGIALLPDDGAGTYDLLMSAETAMAFAKRSGGHGFRRYSREMSASSAERIALESELRRAIERDELFLQFQPCIDACSGITSGAEALIRWQHPQHGLILPDRFIPLADESGLIVEIGEWVLRKACQQGKRWHDMGYPHLSISVNVSAVQFGEPRLLEVVRKVLRETGFEPQCLNLEITESVLMSDAEGAIGLLRALKNMGVKISVDDFGTGYSSLSYLKRFPIDVLKIDKSFVCDVIQDEDSAAIVRAIMALARSLRLKTIAEGVETLEQVNFLQAEKVDKFQGYYFSRPIDANDFHSRLMADERQGIVRLHRRGSEHTSWTPEILLRKRQRM